MSDTSDTRPVQTTPERPPLVPVLLTSSEASEVGVAATASLADPHFQTDDDTLNRALDKLDAAASPFDDPFYQRAVLAEGWEVVRVEGLTAWHEHPDGKRIRVEATIGEDTTIYTARQVGKRGLIPGGTFYRFHNAAAEERFAATEEPPGARRWVGPGWVLESYTPDAIDIGERTAPAIGRQEPPRSLAA